MSDQYRDFGKDYSSNMQGQYSVPPTNFLPQSQSGNFEKKQNWNYDQSAKNSGYKSVEEDGGNYKGREDYGNRNQFEYGDKNRGSSSRYGSGGGNNKGNFNKGNAGFAASSSSSSSNDMITQEDTIFVSGMNSSITESDIHNHFGAIGIIKKDKKTMKPKIWLYKNKESGISKGEATVTYDDINAAQSAISWFDGRDFNGSVIKVSLAQRQNNWSKSGGGRKSGFSGSRGSSSGQMPANSGNERSFSNRNYDRGGSDNDYSREDRGNRGGNNQNRSSSIQQRDGDWKCAECSNTNFAWRNECNRCKSPKSDGPGNSSFDRPNFKNSMDSNSRGNNRSGGFSRGGSRRDGGGGPMKNDNGIGGSRSKPY